MLLFEGFQFDRTTDRPVSLFLCLQKFFFGKHLLWGYGVPISPTQMNIYHLRVHTHTWLDKLWALLLPVYVRLWAAERWPELFLPAYILFQYLEDELLDKNELAAAADAQLATFRRTMDAHGRVIPVCYGGAYVPRTRDRALVLSDLRGVPVSDTAVRDKVALRKTCSDSLTELASCGISYDPLGHPEAFGHVHLVGNNDKIVVLGTRAEGKIEVQPAEVRRASRWVSDAVYMRYESFHSDALGQEEQVAESWWDDSYSFESYKY